MYAQCGKAPSSHDISVHFAMSCSLICVCCFDNAYSQKGIIALYSLCLLTLSPQLIGTTQSLKSAATSKFERNLSFSLQLSRAKMNMQVSDYKSNDLDWSRDMLPSQEVTDKSLN